MLIISALALTVTQPVKLKIGISIRCTAGHHQAARSTANEKPAAQTIFAAFSVTLCGGVIFVEEKKSNPLLVIFSASAKKRNPAFEFCNH